MAVALAAAGLFEFNFGDTEVFWMLLDSVRWSSFASSSGLSRRMNLLLLHAFCR